MLKRIKKFKGYQPLPWLNLSSEKRDASTFARWEAIEKSMATTSGSAVDIGCNMGFFTFKLAEKGLLPFGIDIEPGFAIYHDRIRQTTGLSSSFCATEIDLDLMNGLPSFDVTIFLSVFHHWVKRYGYEDAKAMFSTLWRKTQKELFFETGEDKELRLIGVTGDVDEWIANLLAEVCPDAKLERLGRFDKGVHQREANKGTRSLLRLYR